MLYIALFAASIVGVIASSVLKDKNPNGYKKVLDKWQSVIKKLIILVLIVLCFKYGIVNNMLDATERMNSDNSFPVSHEEKANMKASASLFFLFSILCLVKWYMEKDSEKSQDSKITNEADCTTEEIADIVEIWEADIGDIIQFGCYEQDRDESTKDEPIYWDVLDKKGDSILVISHFLLDRQRFSDDKENVAWENSQIRAWLNETFYNEAFNESEKNMIIESVIPNPSSAPYLEAVGKDSRCGILGDMPDTTDRIFLLNWEEAVNYYNLEIQISGNGVKYYGSDEIIAKPSYVVMMEDYEYRKQLDEKYCSRNETGYKPNGIAWALRSQGVGSKYVLFVNQDGVIASIDPRYIFGIRPVMWIHAG
jgi:hypothetical protein